MKTQVNKEVLDGSADPDAIVGHFTARVENVPTQPMTIPNRPMTFPTGDNKFASPEIGAMHDRQEALEIDRREQERIAQLAKLANRD